MIASQGNLPLIGAEFRSGTEDLGLLITLRPSLFPSGSERPHLSRIGGEILQEGPSCNGFCERASPCSQEGCAVWQASQRVIQDESERLLLVVQQGLFDEGLF